MARRSPARSFRAKVGRVLEKTEQAHIQQLLTGIGGKVYVIGTKRKKGDHQGTMQTPGIPDVLAFLPPRPIGPDRVVRPILLFVECKADGGRMSTEQREFQAHCADAEVEHVVGGLNAVIAWLVGRNYVKAEAFPYYRQPTVDAGPSIAEIVKGGGFG